MKHVKKFQNNTQFENAAENKDIVKPFMCWISGEDTVRYNDSVITVRTIPYGYAPVPFVWETPENLDQLIFKKGDDIFLHRGVNGNYSWGVSVNGQYDSVDVGKTGSVWRLDVSIYGVQSDITIYVNAIFK